MTVAQVFLIGSTAVCLVFSAMALHEVHKGNREWKRHLQWRKDVGHPLAAAGTPNPLQPDHMICGEADCDPCNRADSLPPR